MDGPAPSESCDQSLQCIGDLDLDGEVNVKTPSTHLLYCAHLARSDVLMVYGHPLNLLLRAR
jgi:hypothetical protein